jgi:hypothetical protein
MTAKARLKAPFRKRLCCAFPEKSAGRVPVQTTFFRGGGGRGKHKQRQTKIVKEIHFQQGERQ